MFVKLKKITGIMAALAISLLPIAAMAETSKAPDIIHGSADAKVEFIEFSSLTCPHCANYRQETYPKLMEKYVKTGKVKMIYRDFPLDNLAMGAAMLSRCIPSENYDLFMDTLFKKQQEWVRSEDPLGVLKQYAALAGLEADAVDKCVADAEVFAAIRDKMTAQSEKWDIRSTPTVVINGKKYEGNLGFEYFSKIIDQELAK
jgi:protein-disulfide isomerase